MRSWEIWWQELYMTMGPEQQSVLSLLSNLLRKDSEADKNFNLSARCDR